MAGERPEPSDPIDRLTRELRLSEIRRNLSGLDPLEVQQLFFEASDEVRDAIRTAPPIAVKTDHGRLVLLPLVPAEVLDQHARGVAELSNPEAAAHIGELSELRGIHASLASALKAVLNDAVPGGRIVTEDPVAASAAG